MNKEAQVQKMTDMMAKFVGYTGKKLPDDVIAKLEELRSKEDSPLAKVIYDTMFRNQELAARLDLNDINIPAGSGNSEIVSESDTAPKKTTKKTNTLEKNEALR